MSDRTVIKIVPSMATSDGAGVRLRRSIGTPKLDHLDPFLLLDEFRSDSADDYIRGFPDHPHRGFETVTYMLAGAMQHRDHTGNEGNLTAGSIQWMTAGRGIIHSEMPQQEDGLMWGFQLWVNLPRKHKMTAPRYQDIAPDEVPVVERGDGVQVRVLAGEVDGRTGPVEGIVTQPTYLDVTVPAGVEFEHALPEGHTAFAYPFEGGGTFGIADDDGGAQITRGTLAIFSKGDRLRIRAGAKGVRFILLAARPLDEPIARYGPFVMNTQEELVEAFEDYRAGRLGR